MKVLSLPLGADTGGVSESIRQAFATVADPDWDFRAIISTINYLEYPRDLEWTRLNVKRFWQWADIVHLHHNLSYVRKLNRWHLPAKPYVVHFHGTGFRENPASHLAELHAHGATGIVATLDLWLLAPELEWLPCPVNVERMQAMRKPGDDVIRIAHAPTNREIKSTATVIDSVNALKAEGYPVELDLIEGVTWAECLSRKATADIYVDQVKLGYGNNAIECWGMGIPVIAGGAEATLEEMERRFGSLPFYNATEATMLDALRTLVEDPGQRDAWAQRGLRHVQEFHDERVVVEQLKELYQRAAGVKVEAA